MVMPTCREVSRSIATDELSAAGWRQRLGTKLHLLMCRHCRRYTRQLREIGEAARQVFSDTAMASGDRDRLRGSILEQIPSDAEDGSDPKV
jgi:hypothetical protein